MEVDQFTPIELAIMAHARMRGMGGSIPDYVWPMMSSDVSTTSYDCAAYGRRFNDVFPCEIGINSFEDWTDNFERIWGRRPQTLEIMGNHYFMETLGLSGVFVNWTPDYEPGIYVYDGSRLEVNGDIEQIAQFKFMLQTALGHTSADGKVDLIVWKGEGGLNCLLPQIEAFAYWWDMFAGLLRPGGSAFIQNPFYMEDGNTATSAVGHLRSRLGSNGHVKYSRSNEFDRFNMRIDKF